MWKLEYEKKIGSEIMLFLGQPLQGTIGSKNFGRESE